MEIINRKNHLVKMHSLRVVDAVMTFSKSKMQINFNSGASNQFDLSIGLRIHFMVDIGRLYFYCNNDINGFELKDNKKGNLKINSKAAYMTIQEKIPGKINPGNKFYLKKLQARINDEDVIEVLLNTKMAPMVRKYSRKNLVVAS